MLIRISVTPSDMGDSLIVVHMFIEIDVDDKNYLYQILFDYTYMLRIGCKHMILITKTWLKLAYK
jgi:hypothetical protein